MARNNKLRKSLPTKKLNTTCWAEKGIGKGTKLCETETINNATRILFVPFGLSEATISIFEELFFPTNMV